jgi:hypothetical protein
MPAPRCIILVPYGGSIDPACEQGLDELERRGYAVRRSPGFSQIDVGRCAMASVALAEGFDELLWIDSDIAFHPDDVERLRGHPVPFVCGLYAKKSRREFACDLLPGTDNLVLGSGGGLCEIRYAGFGFTLTRREVYEVMRARLQLPECNQRFGERMVPYFQPLVVSDGPGEWYLGEDYAFCERARRCGFQVMADTRIRLWHVGSYPFSWEDAGSPKERYTNYTFRLGGRSGGSA